MASTVRLLFLLSLFLAYTAAGEHCPSEVSLEEDIFGYLDDKVPVKRYTFTNKKNGIIIQVITYGGRISAVKIPDKNGKVEDIVLGFDDLEGYLGDNPYFGAMQGRVGNRIGGGNFTLDGKTYILPANEVDNGRHNTLSGGPKGFDKEIWEPYVKENKLILSYLSKDGENGFPHTVLTQVIYELNDNTFCFTVHAFVTNRTPLNIINHSHFNLAGQCAGPKGLYEHVVSINADKYTETRPDELLTGKILSVEGTCYDFRIPVNIGETKKLIDFYDNNFCVNEQDQELRNIGIIKHPESGKSMMIKSTQVGVQFYTGGHLTEEGIKGKHGCKYTKYGAIFLEPQHYPDAVHHPNFPSIIVGSAKPYYQKTCYVFYTTK